jgi:hypothetical protein
MPDLRQFDSTRLEAAFIPLQRRVLGARKHWNDYPKSAENDFVITVTTRESVTSGWANHRRIGNLRMGKRLETKSTRKIRQPHEDR